MSGPNCYDCIYRGNVPGDAHSTCHHPEIKNKNDNEFGALVQMVSGGFVDAARKLKIKGNSHGIRSGWFFWPANFDPVWLENCEGFTPKKPKENPNP